MQELQLEKTCCSLSLPMLSSFAVLHTFRMCSALCRAGWNGHNPHWEYSPSIRGLHIIRCPQYQGRWEGQHRLKPSTWYKSDNFFSGSLKFVTLQSYLKDSSSETKCRGFRLSPSFSSPLAEIRNEWRQERQWSNMCSFYFSHCFHPE